ncbi:zinc finger protein 292b [Oncorhynchus tshawytscha]|uniref:C2H2-type domain-containing protein n=1 Tax=Oncorhynchus tshawytscha TaxID=74940 RepID=A0A8C8GAC1_ONCTS|nr:zinc finger protein 292b [Oncorhynchus tshawytscha]
MADDEAEQGSAHTHSSATITALREKLQELAIALKNSAESPTQSSSQYCQDFCQTLVEYAGRWRMEKDPLPLVEVYTVALLSYAQASPCLSSQCENVPLVLERLSLSCVELLLSLPEHFPGALWEEFQSSVQSAQSQLQENGITQLSLLSTVAQETGVWTNGTLHSLLSNESPQTEKVHKFLELEGPILLELRVKHLIKENYMERAVLLAKACAEYPEFEGKGHFKQMYLVCLCAVSAQEPLMEELSNVDCRDALEMICNLESEGDERGAFSLCSAFLTRQLLQGDTYCAWELTLFWSKLLKRLESSEETFLDRCRQMSLLSKTVFHILFLIKVIQSEVDKVGLSVCVDMCIRALQLESSDVNTKATICKTISCLLPTDLEVKRACQLTEFLLEPTVDSYYAVETLYNEPDQKLEEENLPVPNSLRCELLLVFKTQWAFDPEFWDWKTLKRHCLTLMGKEASIVSSIDLLNDNESPEATEEEDTAQGEEGFRDVTDCFIDTTHELNEIADKRQKNRETKKLREKGFISARFRNWQAYMQYCVLCDKEFLGHRIVRHAQTHYKNGLYSCPICAETFTSKDTLEPHVASHVKLSCKERLAAIKTNKKLANPKTAAPVIAALKAKTENQLWTKDANGESQEQNGQSLQTEMVQTKVSGLKTESSTEENTCPIANCKKGFKYFRNLLVHVKAHGENDEAKRFLEMQSKKVICQYCRRQFVNVTHLNDHLQVHCGVRPYICIQLNCKACFLSNTELLVHREEHVVFKARCMFPRCGKIFNEAYKLYDHESQHYKTFTCKVPNCGKVFHSQSQLDLHQEEHVTKEEEDPATDSDLSHSLDQRMLSDQASFSEDVDEASRPPASVAVKHSIDHLLNASQGPVQNDRRYVNNSEPQEKELYPCSESSVIRSTRNAQMHDPNELQRRPQDPSVTAAYDYMRPKSQPHNPLASYQDTADLHHALQPNVLQGQDQGLLKGGSYGSRNYNSDYRVPVQVQQQQHPHMCVTMSAASQTPNYLSTPMPQTLPYASHTLLPLVTHLPATGCRTENSITQCLLPSTPAPQQSPLPSTPAPQQHPLPTALAPPQGQKERHHCALDTCDRNYSSYKSVTKHMKAVHPEFYTEWKLAKKKIREQEKVEKARKAIPSSVPLIGSHNYVAPLQHQQANVVPVHRQNVIQPPQYPNSHHSYASHSAAVQSQAFPNQMDNILDPIVLSQLGNNPNQYAPPSMPWLQTPGNNQIQNCYAPQVYPSNIQGMPQMDAVGGGMDVYVIPSRHMMGSNMERPAESLQPSPMDNGLQPVFPSYMDILKDSSLSNQLENAAPSYKPPSQNNPGCKSRGLQKTNMESHFAPAGSLLAKSNSASQDGTINSGDAKNQMGKKVKRNKRTKWPAIIKDGKFICSRCGRGFTNPKSLGGHLSKRAHCKAFDETELLTADLPSSFLDLLNSEQLLNTQPPQSSLYNPTAPFANDGEQPDDILKQIMDTPNISNVFEPLAIPQPTFQNACGPYVGRLPESTVIQHTGNIQVKNENESYRDGYLPQSCDPGFGSSAFSDPLLFQMLAENNPTVSLHRLPTDHIDHLLRSETLTKMKEVKGTSDSVSSSGGLSNDGLLAAMASLAQNLMTNPMLQITSPDPPPQQSPAATSSELAERQRKSTEQNVKKRLREQILAGDFQRRSSLSQASSTDTNASLSPVSSNPATNVVPHFGAHQSPQPSTTIDHGIPSVSSDQVNGAASMQSFTNFREASSQHHEATAPTSIVANDVDLGPNLTPVNQQHWMVDIQNALERLDLDKQVCDIAPTYSSIKANGTDICNESFRPNVLIEKDTQIPDGSMKPFACESDNCTYRTMTKCAILKHLTKTHNYTNEMINSIKKDHGKFAPFSCQMCDKTFTRNSNLRAHCQTAHRLTQQEIAQLKMKCQSSNTVGFVNKDDKPSVYSEPPLSGQMVTAPHSITENITRQYSLPDVNQNQDVTGNNLFASGERTKQEYHSQPLEQRTSQGMAYSRFNDNSLSMGMQPMQRIPMHDQTVTPLMPTSEYQMNAHCSTIPQVPLMTAPDTDQWSNGQNIPVPSMPSHYSQQSGGYLTDRAASMTPASSDPLQVCGPSLETSPKVKQQRGPKPKVEIPKKTKEKKSEANNAFSPYRPYRCVHQGCAAAFTIQHNLILHYRAVHQSALSTCEMKNDQNDEPAEKKDIKQERVMDEEPEGEVTQVTEFRCQVSDCSRVFQDVPNLLQHYLQLHKFSLDKAGSLMSNINLGRFSCDQQGCTTSFTAFWKYIGHIEKEHDKAKLSKMESVDGMFQCDVDGCAHAYATKSNLLRHTMKKHHDLYKLQLMNQRKSEDLGKPSSKNSHYQLTKSSDGKENIESNKKITEKGGDKKRTDKTEKNHWTKYGKPSLKTKDEASAMCIKKSTLQYPCMIKGCDSVMKSERSIMKHYMGHGLSERYLEEQRSHFIFCKKYPRRRNPRSGRSDDSKSETTSEISDSEDTADTGQEGSEYDEYSKPALRRRGQGGLSDTKPSYDETSETVSDSSVVVKRKRGRPRKINLEKIVKRKRVSRLTRSNAVCCGENGSDYDSSSTVLTQDEMNDQSETLTSFKPMGFEMSFLKFLEQSNPPKNSVKKRIQLGNATVLCKRSDAYLHYPKGFDTLEFRNPQKLTSLNNVKIVVDKAFSDVADNLLKQLQEMRPTVILEK